MLHRRNVRNGNGEEWEKPYGNPMGMGIGYKIGNGNGKEWESIAREWEWECKKPFPGISNVNVRNDDVVTEKFNNFVVGVVIDKCHVVVKRC